MSTYILTPPIETVVLYIKLWSMKQNINNKGACAFINCISYTHIVAVAANSVQKQELFLIHFSPYSVLALSAGVFFFFISESPLAVSFRIKMNQYVWSMYCKVIEI